MEHKLGKRKILERRRKRRKAYPLVEVESSMRCSKIDTLEPLENGEFGVCSLQFTVSGLQFTVLRLRFTVCGLPLPVASLRFKVCSL